ncbi:MAG: SUMF1/EgtB/PvdO family nonheme iron enzyme [Myxococcota bacterium]
MLKDAKLMHSPLGDGALFDVLGRWYKRSPPEAMLWEAAELYEGASPAMVQGAARWLGVERELGEAGLDAATVARVFVSAAVGEPQGWAPPGPVLARVLEAAGDAFDPGAVATELLEADELPHAHKSLFTLCVAMSAQRGTPIPESHDAHIIFHVPWPHLRAIVEGLPEARRDALLVRLIGTPGNANAARVQMRYTLPVLDLATGTGAKASIAKARAHLEGKERWTELLAAMDAGGGPPAEREGPTEECRKAVEYWLEKYESTRRVDGIGDAARQTHARAVEVDAPELASFETWKAASEERRTAIAERVAARVEGLAFSGFETFEGAPLASFHHDDLVFRLVPGGSYDRGLSPEEEALVRAASEVARPAGDNWFEEFGNFLEKQLHSMRPLMRATVGPLLVCASPGYSMTPDTVVPFLDETQWRLLSETEWEYLARGGKEHELTWRGHEVPDEAWFQRTDSAEAEAANAFGCWGFGLQPELCADVWKETYEGAPVDGAPRFGDGTRVARGGAAMLYPWQQVGEWQLLCSAVRSPSVHWEFEVNVRPVLGVTC